MINNSAIWVTGASSGIGKALAIKFANKNHLVVGSARRVDLIEQIRKDLIEPKNLIVFKNDISNNKEITELTSTLQKKYNIECIINNAGVTSFKPFIENSVVDIEQIIDTNLKGSIYAIKSVLPKMIENNSGTIINILSVAANKIFQNSALYASSKAGLKAFSKVIREELREKNIKIINIYPGATVTEMWAQSVIDDNSDKMMSTQHLANFIYDVYSNSKFISPEEIEVKPITGDL